MHTTSTVQSRAPAAHRGGAPFASEVEGVGGQSSVVLAASACPASPARMGLVQHGQDRLVVTMQEHSVSDLHSQGTTMKQA